jgi:hypothetical protein
MGRGCGHWPSYLVEQQFVPYARVRALLADLYGAGFARRSRALGATRCIDPRAGGSTDHRGDPPGACAA